MSSGITPKQLNVLKAINEYIKDNKISPTNRELCTILNYKSSSTMHGFLESLIKKGYITNKENSPRTIRLTEKGKMQLSGKCLMNGYFHWFE